MKIYKNNYCILDNEQNRLLCFDKHGKYISDISSQGKGPGEYALIYDFNINNYTGNIEIADAHGRILVFSNDLIHLKTLYPDAESIYRFHLINKDTIVLYSLSSNRKLLFYSRHYDTIFNKLYVLNEDVMNFPGAFSFFSPFQSYKNQTLFSQPYSDTIYNLSECKMKVWRIINLEDNSLNWSKIENGRDLYYYVSYFMKLKDQAFSYYYFIETDNMVFSRFAFNKSWISLIYNKQNNESLTFKNFREDLHPPVIYYQEGDTIYSVMEYAMLHKSLNEDILNSNQSLIFKSIKPEDNPVIVKYVLK